MLCHMHHLAPMSNTIDTLPVAGTEGTQHNVVGMKIILLILLACPYPN